MSTNSSLNGKLVTVFGGDGFIGNYVVQALLERGARVRIASRHPEKGWPLKPLANLGQLQFAHCDVTDKARLEAALHDADAAVNLVGVFDGDLEDVMVRAPGNMARIASEHGLESFVHVSAIGADADSKVAYARAKRMGEIEVLKHFAGATILRPSVVFGKDDNFINMFAGLIENVWVLPVFGGDAEMQPVYVDDVAEAAAIALEHPETHGGQIFELGGPERLTMLEINERIAAAQGRDRRFWPVSDSTAKLFARLPLTPLSMDQYRLLKAGNVVSGEHPGFAELGITARPIGLFLDRWMTRYRKFGRFGLSNDRNKERELRGVPAPETGAGARI
ncbi:complex I NDUFA9 subunit family protein [Qipengyuania nanhaisediminis]|uniref:complex I NDUFA9 subunit family protein n=1 Tax=Qipengyuania nanhaisediminis TaxID=604088 RepID=UPI0038B30212